MRLPDVEHLEGEAVQDVGLAHQRTVEPERAHTFDQDHPPATITSPRPGAITAMRGTFRVGHADEIAEHPFGGSRA